MTRGRGKDEGHGAWTETRTAVNAEEVAAAAVIGGRSEETKSGMEEMRKAGGKTGMSKKKGARRENDPVTGRTGRTKRTADIKTIESDTERRERPREAEVEAEIKGTKVKMRKVENVSTAGRETEMESRALTSAAAAKKGLIISASPIMNTVNTVNAGEVTAWIELSL